MNLTPFFPFLPGNKVPSGLGSCSESMMRSAVFLLIVTVMLTADGCSGARPRAEPASTPELAIEDVTVVDVVAGALRPHTTVLVAGTRIVGVAPAREAVVPAGAQVVDGRGRYLIPGLWDMHSHSLWSEEAVRTFLPLYVAQGVTGIRDMGGRLDVLASVRTRLGQAQQPWPRIVAAGAIIDGPKPVQADISIGVSDPASAARAVQHLADSGVDFIKVYTLLPRDAYFAVMAKARKLGLNVVGHVPAAVTPEEAARAGQKSFEHLRDEIEPLCAHAGDAKCRRLARVLVAMHTWQVPTLTNLHSKAYFDDPAVVVDPRLRYVPTSLRAEWFAERDSKLHRGPAYAAGKRTRFANELRLTGFFYRAGVPLLAGTDAGTAFCYPGFGLHDELALLVAAGLTPLDALRTATIAPAEYLGERDVTGTMDVGKFADMVLLNADPLADIEATRNIEAVVLRGRLLRRGDLDALLAGVASEVASPAPK